MIGSNGAREGVEPAPLWPPWRMRQCVVCEKVRQAAVACERAERLGEVLSELDPSKALRLGLGHTTICKDCCIAQMDGHHCIWWGLCWRR